MQVDRFRVSDPLHRLLKTAAPQPACRRPTLPRCFAENCGWPRSEKISALERPKSPRVQDHGCSLGIALITPFFDAWRPGRGAGQWGYVQRNSEILATRGRLLEQQQIATRLIAQGKLVDMPHGLRRVIAKCLHLKPSLRPTQSARHHDEPMARQKIL